MVEVVVKVINDVVRCASSCVDSLPLPAASVFTIVRARAKHEFSEPPRRRRPSKSTYARRAVPCRGCQPSWSSDICTKCNGALWCTGQWRAQFESHSDAYKSWGMTPYATSHRVVSAYRDAALGGVRSEKRPCVMRPHGRPTVTREPRERK